VSPPVLLVGGPTLIRSVARSITERADQYRDSDNYIERSIVMAISMSQAADWLMSEYPDLPLSDVARIVCETTEEMGADELLVAEYSHPTDISEIVSFRPTEVSNGNA
jgi:hypothetical protein